MKYFAALILISFLGLVFIGFLPMDHNTHHMTVDAPCPIATVFNVNCGADTASMAVIHISALQSLFVAPISTNIALFSLLLAVGLAFLLFSQPPNIFLPNGFRFSRRKFFYAQLTPLEKERSWLSLFEHSPSFA